VRSLFSLVKTVKREDRIRAHRPMSPTSTMSRQQVDSSLVVGDAITVRIRGVETAAELLKKEGNRLRVKLVATGRNSWCASRRCRPATSKDAATRTPALPPPDEFASARLQANTE
jgi:hypothetical protein